MKISGLKNLIKPAVIIDQELYDRVLGRGERMSELTEQVDAYIETIIKDGITGFATREGVAFHYRDNLIHLITEACVEAVKTLGYPEDEIYAEAIRALGEVKE